MAAISLSVSPLKRLIATTVGTPNWTTFSIWRPRFSQPRSTAPTSSADRSSPPVPPFIFSARTVGDDHRRIRLQSGLSALDVEEFLCPEIRAEPGFRDDVVGKLEGSPGCDDGVAAMGDVGERSAMDECGVVLKGLDQVRLHRLPQEHGHGAVCLEVAAIHRGAVAPIGHYDVTEPALQIPEVTRQAQDRHDLGGCRDVEPALARESVGNTSKRAIDLAQRPVIHIQHAAPNHTPDIDSGLVAPEDAVVDHRAQQVVGRSDGMQVPGEMEVDVVHGHDLGVATSCRAALHSETGSERRFPQADRRSLADPVQCVPESDRGRGLAFHRPAWG